MPRTFTRSLVLVVLCGAALSAFAGHRFHASGLVMGGERRSSVGSISLASTGGEGTTTVRDHDDGFVRFAEATSSVKGWREGDVAVTLSEVVIRNVEIGGRVKADLLVARLRERHPSNAAEAEILFDGSSIVNLTIDGVPVDATLDTAFFTARPTFAAMSAEGFEGRLGTIVCSAHGTASCGSERLASWALRVPGLGTVTIGEVFVKNGHRQLNLLRVQTLRTATGDGRRRLGTNDGEEDEGTIIGSVEGNGTPVYP